GGKPARQKGAGMNRPQKMMMIFVDETDTWRDVSLYEAIVRKLVHMDIAGATVLAGIMGFGSHGRVHRKRLFGISDDRPITIIAVDTEEKIRNAAAEVRPMLKEGLILLSDVEVMS